MHYRDFLAFEVHCEVQTLMFFCILVRLPCLLTISFTTYSIADVTLNPAVEGFFQLPPNRD